VAFIVGVGLGGGLVGDDHPHESVAGQRDPGAGCGGAGAQQGEQGIGTGVWSVSTVRGGTSRNPC
jgi:hypothetical protein